MGVPDLFATSPGLRVRTGQFTDNGETLSISLRVREIQVLNGKCRLDFLFCQNFPEYQKEGVGRRPGMGC